VVVIFIHQNFPAQYVHVARHLAQDPGNRVFFITQAEHNDLPGVVKLIYKPDRPPVLRCHPYTATFDVCVRTGIAVAAVCRDLRDRGIVPDLVVGHCGWGEMLFVKNVYPDVPVLSNFEYFYHATGADVGFDPEFAPSATDDSPRLQVRNALNRMSFASCDWGHTATAWQRSLFPASMQSEISLVHEGVDTQRVCPDASAWLKLAREDIVLTRSDEVITYVARNLEPYRGFHVFMRALPEILRRRPYAHVLIAGGDGISYGEPPPEGGSYRQLMLNELGDRLDRSRVHFLGHVPHDVYVNLLQVSSVHVYFSYPFVLSWSFIEAMAAGCLIVASATEPVLEVLRDRQNGLAVDFFSAAQLCERIDEALEHPDRMQAVRDAARETAVRDFDLETRLLPRWMDLLSTLASGRRPPREPPTEGLATRLGLR
jgi:glycosyltransferase involved in cell wall biosynthesis